jgi:4-hydroxy-tetrahydrodipicolinate synthase
MLARKDLWMNAAQAKRLFRGPMIPVITNLDADLNVDHEAIAANVCHVVEHGITTGQGALLAVGAGGDFPMLSVDERKAAAKTIVDAAEGRAPVLVGAQDTNVEVCIELAQWAEEIGAEGIQLAPPHYYEPTDDDVLRWFQAVHDATEHVAIMIYNTWWEGYHMSLEQVERLCGLERCLSLKWSAPMGARPYMQGVARFAERMAVVCNQGMPVLNRLLGGTGYITHLATVWPEHDVAVWTLLEAEDYAGAQAKLMAANWPWYGFRVKMAGRTGGESPTVKAALELCGRPGGPSRLPSRPLSEEERGELRELLIRIGAPGIQ